MATSKENSKSLAYLDDKNLEIMFYWGMLASYMLSFSSKISNPDYTSQNKFLRILNPIESMTTF